MLQDLNNACRELLKNRWFTCVTVLTLALGIGANTAIFGVVNKLMLNPLPYANADRFVYLRLQSSTSQFGAPVPHFVVGAWRERARSLDGIEAFTYFGVLTYDENGGRVLRGMRITPGLPALFRMAPLLGRGFTAADAEAGAPAVVTLSYELWQREYGGAADVVGRTITLDEAPHVVVGVMPPRWDAFARGVRPDVWFPLPIRPTSAGPMQFVDVIARLKPDLPPEGAVVDLDAIFTAALAEAARPIFGDNVLSTRIERPADRINGSARDTLLVLLGAVGLVLLVACSNVANLLLARGASRARELSVRAALGASTWRLARALFAECLVLALAAGAVGVLIGWLTLRILTWLRPATLPAFGEVELDATLLGFTFGISVATALLFGLAPAVQLRSRKLAGALRHGASGAVRGGMGPRLRKLLVAAQMAMSVVLLVSAGLLVRSVTHLQSIDVGFDTADLFSAQLTLPRGRYQEAANREVLAQQLLERVRSSPGVAAATQAFVAPPAWVTMVGAAFEVRGTTLAETEARLPRPFNYVPPEYFSTLRIGLEGRAFTADELRNGGAVVVNRAAAQKYWPEGNALGSELKWGAEWSTVVGIADDVASGGLLRAKDEPQFYWPLQSQSTPTMGNSPPAITLIVRATKDTAVAITALRAAVRELDAEIAVTNLLMTETALANSIDGPRFNMALLTAFAVLALVLAAVGLAAVIGYEVTERTHEIGIRMALGARTENVRRLAMRHGLTPAFVGVIIGMVAALGATQLAASLLYGVTPRDPLTFIAVVVLLVGVALAASWLPARRATRVDPIIALRAD
jgi:putative ABC transport system permease protein